MTKGEALKKMQAVKAYMTSGNPIWDVTEIGEAFYMAIEALEQSEPNNDEWCTDCKEYDQERQCCPRWSKVIRQTLKDAQPERWIPCSETIDIPENEVLCCDRYGNEIIGYLAYADDQWLCESDGEMMYEPVAWMEKPDPWKGES